MRSLAGSDAEKEDYRNLQENGFLSDASDKTLIYFGIFFMVSIFGHPTNLFLSKNASLHFYLLI
jgi:hypothetical protein